MTRKIEFAPELIAEGKRLYEETDVPIHAIAARMGYHAADFVRTHRRVEMDAAPL